VPERFGDPILSPPSSGPWPPPTSVISRINCRPHGTTCRVLDVAGRLQSPSDAVLENEAAHDHPPPATAGAGARRDGRVRHLEIACAADSPFVTTPDAHARGQQHVLRRQAASRPPVTGNREAESLGQPSSRPSARTRPRERDEARTTMAVEI